MKIRLKETQCPQCLAELVVDGGTVTCTDGCDLPQDGWHKDTQSKIEPMIAYQRSVEGCCDDGLY